MTILNRALTTFNFEIKPLTLPTRRSCYIKYKQKTSSKSIVNLDKRESELSRRLNFYFDSPSQLGDILPKTFSLIPENLFSPLIFSRDRRGFLDKGLMSAPGFSVSILGLLTGLRTASEKHYLHFRNILGKMFVKS